VSELRLTYNCRIVSAYQVTDCPLVSSVTPFTCFGGTGVVPSCSVNETVVYLPYMHLDYIGDSVTVQCLHGF